MTLLELRGHPFLFSGVFDLDWWQLALVALALTHVTIAAVTIFLHRHQAHRALELHALPSYFFRIWLWMTTGMVTKEWAAIHRKHHAKCEAVEDPHSPQIHGISRILWGGVELYVKESYNKETLERYGHGTPCDWLERNLLGRFTVLGPVLMGVIDVCLFGLFSGLLVLVAQLVWIPFWAAGVINGIGHFWGYRTFDSLDASTNIVPWGILIGGEELHNNHHAFATSAKLSNKWYEFDIGWGYIRALEVLRLAEVKRVAPTPRFTAAKAVCDHETLQAVLTHRYDILATYAKSLKATYAQELGRLRRFSPSDALMLQGLRRWLHRDDRKLAEAEREKLEAVLAVSKPLQTVYNMRKELMVVWERSSATREQLVKQLQDWCHRAEASGITPLIEFSQRLRSYA
ncbi:MAG: acyl-CoA desaturase [Betaproteobacteria bacterium]|nr:acyl-CoA desaturase [Betaproteobacteria bacterium]